MIIRSVEELCCVLHLPFYHLPSSAGYSKVRVCNSKKHVGVWVFTTLKCEYTAVNWQNSIGNRRIRLGRSHTERAKLFS
jgi:hypothetical protein